MLWDKTSLDFLLYIIGFGLIFVRRLLNVSIKPDKQAIHFLCMNLSE